MQPRGNQTWKPRPNQEQTIPNTLAPSYLVNQDSTTLKLKHNFHIFSTTPLKHHFHLFQP